MIEIFSPDFCEKIWAKQPAELKKGNIELGKEDLFVALRAYTQSYERICALNPRASLSFSFDGDKAERPPREFLLAESDIGFDQYLERIDVLAGEREWALMYFGLHAASPFIWDLAKKFADALASSIGYRPGGRVDIDCFLGRYSSTYVGIDCDDAHNFAYTLKNGKIRYSWDADKTDLFGLKAPHYEQYKKDSIALVNAVDRIAYFPHDALHVAETKEQVSANVNIAFWEKSNEAHAHEDYLQKMLYLPSRTKCDVTTSGMVGLGAEDELQLAILTSLIKDGQLQKKNGGGASNYGNE